MRLLTEPPQYFKVFFFFFKISFPFCLISVFTDKLSKMEGIGEIFQDSPTRIFPRN